MGDRLPRVDAAFRRLENGWCLKPSKRRTNNIYPVLIIDSPVKSVTIRAVIHNPERRMKYEFLGTITLYQLQRFTGQTWVAFQPCRADLGGDDTDPRIAVLVNDFGGSGDCYRKTGLYGTLSKEAGQAALVAVWTHRPDELVRLVCRVYTVTQVEVEVG